jgi:hypothetical protein
MYYVRIKLLIKHQHVLWKNYLQGRIDKTIGKLYEDSPKTSTIKITKDFISLLRKGRIPEGKQVRDILITILWFFFLSFFFVCVCVLCCVVCLFVCVCVGTF